MMYAVDIAFSVSKQFFVNADSPESAARMAVAEVAKAPVKAAREFEAVLSSEVLTSSPLNIIDFE